jgi:hypothetical protein
MRIVKAISALAAIGAVTATAAVATTSAGAAAPQSAAAARQYEGTVVSVNRSNRTFRLHDSERGTVRVKVNGNTRYERINGFRGLKAGMRNVETIVRRSGGAWLALEVERSGGGGEHGGGRDDDDDDDRRGRGRDDSGDDDGGGRGRGRGRDD